jgi:hypothetical protein
MPARSTRSITLVSFVERRGSAASGQSTVTRVDPITQESPARSSRHLSSRLGVRRCAAARSRSKDRGSASVGTPTHPTVTTDDIGCGAGGTDQATVWYTLTLAAATSILVDATASDYAVGVNIFEGSADADNLVNCVEGAAVFDAAAGTTYFLMFADVDGDATNGGQLHVSIDVAPPPIEVSLTVDPNGKVNPKTGEATISGTISCSRTADFGEVDVNLREPLGRFTIHGFGFDSLACEPTPTQWFASIAGDNGKFGAGKATAEVSAFACDATSCDDDSVVAGVRLRK